MKNATISLAARSNRAASWMMSLILAGTMGCGSGQKSTSALAPVSGKVTLDGNPLTEATLEFIPKGDTKGQGGSGASDDQGHFVISTPFGEEGLPPGDYTVVISKLVLPPDMHFDVPPDKNLPPIETPYRESLPAHYSDRTNSKLSIKVAELGTDKMSFTLTAGKKK